MRFGYTIIYVKNIKEKRKIYTLDIVVKAIKDYVNKHPEASNLWDQFFELLTFDALIGSTDRHYYNWGVLEKADDGKFLRLAPAFDNGVSLMWKMESARPLLLRSLLTRDFPRRAEAMFKKIHGGKYTLYEVLPALYSSGEYSGSSIVKKMIEKVSSVPDSRIRSVLLKNIPQRVGFKTRKEELEIVFLYVKLRRELLLDTLNKIKI